MPSRPVLSSQTAVHKRLADTLKRHRQAVWRKPIAEHTRHAFAAVEAEIQATPKAIILDSGCGVGESTLGLATLYPDHWVVGVDKSAKRLTKTPHLLDNMLFVRAELADFWRLVLQAQWSVAKHYVLYPNPWPKLDQLQRRWHGHPVFPEMLHICPNIELRTNWQLYAEEFCFALNYCEQVAEFQEYQPVNFLTPFERKYALSGQQLWQVTTQPATPSQP